MTPQTPTVQFASFAYGDRTPGHDPAETYHEAAKLYPSFAGRQLRGLSRTDHPAFLESMARASRRHPQRPRVPLPAARAGESLLADVLGARTSRCPAPGSTLSLEDVATLLAPYEVDASGQRRAVPSGGALYPLEIYVLARRVEELEAGVYHFDPFDRALELLAPGEPALAEVLVDPAVGECSAALVAITGMFWRSRCKYGLRGYRFTLLEAGHLVQAMALLATAAGIDLLPLGGVYDAAFDRLLRVDGVNESVVYAAAAGRGAP